MELSEPTGDMLDDEAEEKRARWIFNLVVLFLVLAFAIDLSFMTGSLIPVGVGVSLIWWRVWRTSEITNPISVRLGPRLRRLVQNLAIALGVAPILLGVSVQAAWNPYAVSRGFPFSVTYVIPGCFGPGSPLGCLAYDPLGVVLDYLFWTALSFGVLTLARWVRTRGPLR
jgi:hypothetical protein